MVIHVSLSSFLRCRDSRLEEPWLTLWASRLN